MTVRKVNQYHVASKGTVYNISLRIAVWKVIKYLVAPKSTVLLVTFLSERQIGR